MRIGIIGGTGMYELAEACGRTTRVHTNYETVEVTETEHAGHELVFLARHGAGHAVPPHRVPYLANIDALRRKECECILATNAVGSTRDGMQPGDFVLPDQFIDFTKCRPLTFFDGGSSGVRHVDVTDPYCPALRRTAFTLLEDDSQPIHPAGTYVCTEGPRFETPAEIKMFQALGGDLVGMTGVPEVVLAREAGICYMTVCVVTNFAAGVAPAPLREGEVTELMAQRLPVLRRFILSIIENLEANRDCSCRG